MTEEMNRQEEVETLERTYTNLLTLWTSGVRDYHSLLSDYLTANSIFVAAIGLLVSREQLTMVFTLVILLLCVFGILISLQMAILLGRFSSQNALWEWELRGIENQPTWNSRKLLTGLRHLREGRALVQNDENNPPPIHYNWAARQHRQWWAHRAISFPLFFGTVYGLFFMWSVMQLVGV
jgi:hypothetical protein